MALKSINKVLFDSDGDDKRALNKRLRKLHSITLSIMACDREVSGSGISPIGARALVLGVFVCALLLGLSLIAQNLGFTARAAPFAAQWIAIVVAISLLSAVGYFSKSTQPRTWCEVLDRELASYDPVDKDSYRDLQQKIRALGFFDAGTLMDWCQRESDAVVRVLEADQPKTTFRDKRV